MKTSYYANLKNIDTTKFQPIAISGDEGKMVGFTGKGMRKLSPYCFFRKWKEKEVEIEEKYKNKKITEQDYILLKYRNENEYIENFYYKVLKKLNPQEVYNELGENAVLLCFEKPTQFCHRFLVASWLELSLGIQIDEYGYENNLLVKNNKESLKSALQALMEFESEANND